MRVLVTGATGGLGYQLAKEAMIRGHQIVAVDIPQADTSALEALSAQYPGLMTILPMDITNRDQISETVKLITEKWGALDGVINVAGILIGREQTFEELDFDLVRKSLEVNLFGAMNVLQISLPLIYKGEKPVIINVSSEGATIVNAFPTNYAYAISKTSLNMFTERLKAHFVKEGRDILIWAIHPGWMRTSMGGENAPVDPADTAKGFWDIMERKTVITSKITFINAFGKPMPL